MEQKFARFSPAWSLLLMMAYVYVINKMVIWLTPLKCPRGLWLFPTVNHWKIASLLRSKDIKRLKLIVIICFWFIINFCCSHKTAFIFYCSSILFFDLSILINIFFRVMLLKKKFTKYLFMFSMMSMFNK